MKIHKIMLVLEDNYLIELLELLFNKLKLDYEEREEYLKEYKYYEGELIIKLLSVIQFNLYK